jgi:pyridoxal 5'-phosphate synthase pdxT subunit
MKIGVLALQGDFAEHIIKLSGIGVETAEVRLPAGLRDLDGLIIPGGESTTFGKLAEAFGLLDPLREFGRRKAIWGTCAGAILMAREVDRRQPTLGLMDIAVERNAFGRQIDSFETDLALSGVLTARNGSTAAFHAVFIRAPVIRRVGSGVQVLARLDDGTIVAARQGRMLATSFHPELTPDDRFHRYFVEIAAGA